MMSEVRRCVGRDAVLECGHSSGGQPSQDFQKLCQTVKPLDSRLYTCRHVVLAVECPCATFHVRQVRQLQGRSEDSA